MSESGGPEPYRFRKKPLQVSLYFSEEDVGIAADFEGETSSVSRQGMDVRVDHVSMEARDIESDHIRLENQIFHVRFHVPWGKSIRPRARVEMVGSSEDPRFRTYIRMSFLSEINLSRLVSGR